MLDQGNRRRAVSTSILCELGSGAARPLYNLRRSRGMWRLVIRSSDVRNAVLFEARQWFIPVFVLSLQTDSRTYQFGFNPWVSVSSHLPFEFRRERVRLGFSAFSIGIRLALSVYVAYLAWRWFTSSPF